MSLRAFGKGFFGAAAPSFMRGFEQQQGRIETRRQEDRQDKIRKEGYQRDDKLLAESRQREDTKDAYDNAKLDGQGAANESPDAVNAWYDALSPDLQSQFKGIKNQLTTQAKRKTRVRGYEEESLRAQTAASKAQTDASKARGAHSQFQLEQARGDADAADQINQGTITDDNGYQAGVARYLEQIKNGVTHENAPAVSRIAGMLDAYDGTSARTKEVQQGLITTGEKATRDEILRNLQNWTPSMIEGVAFGMGDSDVKKDLLRLSEGIRGSVLDNSANELYNQVYQAAINSGLGEEQSIERALKQSNEYKTRETMYSRRSQLTDIAEHIVSMSPEGTNIETLIDRVKRAVRNHPNLVPRGRDWEWLKGAIMSERGLDQAAQSGPGGPLAGMQTPAEGASLSTGTSPSEPSEPVESMMPGVQQGSIWDRQITQRNFSNMSSEYDKARNPYAPVDATQGR